MMLSDTDNAKNLSGISLDEEDYKICDLILWAMSYINHYSEMKEFAKCFVYSRNTKYKRV